MSPAVMDAPDELKPYDTAKAIIRFPADEPLPAALVRKLVKARIAENEAPRCGHTGRSVSAGADWWGWQAIKAWTAGPTG